MTFDELVSSYVKKTNNYYEKKRQLENKIAKEQEKLNKLNNSSPNWIENLIVPLAKEIKQRLRDKGLDIKAYEIYGPFGMQNEISIYFSNHGKDGNIEITKVKTLSITIRPQWRHNENYTKATGFELSYCTSLSDNGYYKDFAPLPNDIDEIIKRLRQS